MELVFKALADETRRTVLDRLRARNGQTLRELCDELGMARQSATQHIDILVRANLVTVVRRGRERLHYLNPAPIHDIEERWISGFDQPRLRALGAIRRQAEEEHAMTTTVPTYVYVTYIHATAEQVWRALTDADLSARYWGHPAVSDWEPGSPWELQRPDGSGNAVAGKVLESSPPTRLVMTFEDSPDEDREPSTVTFLVEPHESIVRLTVTHERLANVDQYQGISAGWPAVLANLKSLLETGDVLPTAPWAMGRAHA
ncbi:ArsR/SmtB family transcription factor [Dactylosporangium sp. CS-033363]|uniref:ArsR/SmtB family transcription factor n=1 Tax=Dactylosporangium sp. CS-033363 TaxID=3239935 RepID=UPI003D91570E